MKNVYLAPYIIGSKGASALANSTYVKQTKALKRLKSNTILINWGRSKLNIKGNAMVLNQPVAIANASNKLKCLDILKFNNINCVEHTTDIRVAYRWLDEGHVVYCRTLVSASQGRGIVVVTPDEGEIVRAPLYTKGIVKSHEYRVHVFGSRVIDVTKKRRRSGIETNEYIKNSLNGWVYCREMIQVSEDIKNLALKTIHILGLDFGAIDILVKFNIPYVLEVNTAPGLEGTTLQAYSREVERLKYL